MKIIAVEDEATLALYEEWVLHDPTGSIWQSSQWGEFQESLGKKVRRLICVDEGRRSDLSLPGEIVATAQIVETSLGFGKKTWYIPRGPVGENDLAVKALLEEIVAYGKKTKGLIFLVFDPFLETAPDLPSVPSESVQVENSLRLDLKLGEEKLLAQMKPKGRYNIKLAEKKGVVVRKSKSTQDFFRLLGETTERDGFRGWGEEYYKKMLKNLGANAVLLEAVYEDEVIAGGIFTYYGREAVYYYGASSNAHRNLMAPYLLQWTAVCEAMKRGCEFYDFLGIAPEGADTKHPWAGVTDFKLKFGGERVSFPQAKKVVFSGFWDLVYKIKKALL